MENKEDKWFEYYELAKQYYCKNGNLEIEVTYITEDGKKLGSWIAQQRRAYKSKYNMTNSKITPLTDEQIKLLEEIGMTWNVRINKLVHATLNKERLRSLEIKFYKFLGEYAKENNGKFETYEDVKNVGNSFFDRIEKLSKNK